MGFNEVLMRVSWSCLRHPDNQAQHVRRGEVTCDLALEEQPDFTSDEMQAIAYAAKQAAWKALRARRMATSKKSAR